MAIQNRNILGPAADLGPKANDVPGGLDTPQRSGVIDGDTSAVTDQGGPGTAARREELQNVFRGGQAAAGLVSGAGAAGTVIAPAGQVQTEGNVEAGGPGARLAAEGGPVVRSEGGANLADGGTGQAIG